MKTLKEYIDAVLEEENTQGDDGTPKLTKHRKDMTPGEEKPTPDMFPKKINNKSHSTR